MTPDVVYNTNCENKALEIDDQPNQAIIYQETDQ